MYLQKGRKILMDKWFIYSLSDPKSGMIRYIGATTDPTRRYNEHLNGIKQNRTLKKWVESLRRGRLYPKMSILEQVSEREWEQKERQYILEHRNKMGKFLLNKHYGGRYEPYVSSNGKKASSRPLSFK